MKVGLCDRMAAGWLNEFKQACSSLGFEHKIIAIGNDDWMEQLKGLDVFIWRLVLSDPSGRAEADAKIPLIEEMGIACFPNRQMLWLYDDKIRETYFLRRHSCPVPKTWVFFESNSARDFIAKASFPLVAKSHCGASSSGVVILRSRKAAETLLKRVFKGLSLWDKLLENYYYTPRLKKGDLLLQLRFRYRDSWPRYTYFQEFVKTEKDWRITTLGQNLVSVFARENRPDDFRASGSGIWQRITEHEVPIEACDLALAISKQQGFTSMTYDFMQHNGRWVIGELSYTFLLNAVYTETLFQRENGSYKRVEPIPIGIMHLQALTNHRAASANSTDPKPDLSASPLGFKREPGADQ